MKEFSEDMTSNAIAADVQVPEAVHVMMSEDHLYAILRNLVANAVDSLKSPSQGERARSIAIQGTLTDGTLTLEVSDTGHGIEPTLQGRLFELFFSTKGVQGKGLGLAMSKKLSELYGGALTFSSQSNEKTTFCFTIPVARQTPSRTDG